jgi:hypothetical protein
MSPPGGSVRRSWVAKLEGQLAYHRDGIRDHGEEHRLTPIDAVLRYGCAPDAAQQRNGFVRKPYPGLGTNPDLLRQPCSDDGSRSGS